MKLFHRLFFTYLMVSLLALLISGPVFGYMVWEATGRTLVAQHRAAALELADLLRDRNWTEEAMAEAASTAAILDRTLGVRIWLADREGGLRLTSPSAADPGSALLRRAVEVAADGRGGLVREWARLEGHEPAVALPIFSDDRVAGAVILSLPIDGPLRVRRNLGRYILYGSAVATAVIALVSYFLSQRIARPITAVSDAAQQVARGDYGARVSHRPDAVDEVGRLSRSFNEMAAELERLERARRELMANVSHELKGPLARIAGFVEAIRDGVGGPDARARHLEVIRRESARLSRLVNDLLDFSRLEAGRLKLHAFPCDLAPHLLRVAEGFQAPAAEAGVHLRVEIPPRLAPVRCDPERVHQVVANLLENALAFTPRGGTVALTAAEEGDGLRVTVTDTGPGIPPDDLERVWERFFKVDSARSPARGGSGLGLAIVKQLVELHGGQVFADSEVGKGSAFGFWLPLATPDEPNSAR